MLIKINHNQWLDLDDVYLVLPDDYAENELLIYIRPHPKIPIVLKGEDSIEEFNIELDNYQHEQIKRQRCHTKDDTRTSEVILEKPDTSAESGFQQINGEIG